jgi:hypothetical protein
MNKLLITGFLLLTSFSAFSKCEISYDRTACAGKEKESYAKCEDKKTCTKSDAAEDKEECQAAALKACENSRVDVTKSKIITAKFNGAELLSKTGKKDFCEDYAKKATEFNQCK